MISDVLSEAVRALRHYRGLAAYDEYRAEIDRMIEAMESLRIRLDAPPESTSSH